MRVEKIWSLLFLCAVACAFQLSAQKVVSIPEKDSIEIGEPLPLLVVYEPMGQELIMPEFGDTITTEIEVISKEDLDTTTDGSNLRISQRLFITSYDTGYHVIPPIKAMVSGQEVQSYPSLIYVKRTEVNLQENIRGIADISDAPWTLQEWLWFFGKMLFVVLVIVLTIILLKRYYINKRLNKGDSHEVDVKRPYMEEFWERFEAIRSERLWLKGEQKKYHSQVSDLLKSYLEFRYPISVMEKTSSEVLVALRIHLREQGNLSLVDSILNFADLVKFAKAGGDGSEHENALNLLKSFVEKTTLAEEGSLSEKSKTGE